MTSFFPKRFLCFGVKVKVTVRVKIRARVELEEIRFNTILVKRPFGQAY